MKITFLCEVRRQCPFHWRNSLQISLLSMTWSEATKRLSALETLSIHVSSYINSIASPGYLHYLAHMTQYTDRYNRYPSISLFWTFLYFDNIYYTLPAYWNSDSVARPFLPLLSVASNSGDTVGRMFCKSRTPIPLPCVRVLLADWRDMS